MEKFCGLPQPKGMSADNLVKYLIEATEKDFDNEEWTDATKLSMLLLARYVCLQRFFSVNIFMY